VSGLHNALKDRGAYFGTLSNGWERPQFFTSINESTHDTLSYDIHKCNWLKYAKKEWYAARHGVAMFDMSSFGKLRVSGESATRVLEYCTSSVMSDLEIGDVVYTQVKSLSLSLSLSFLYSEPTYITTLTVFK